MPIVSFPHILVIHVIPAPRNSIVTGDCIPYHIPCTRVFIRVESHPCPRSPTIFPSQKGPRQHGLRDSSDALAKVRSLSDLLGLIVVSLFGESILTEWRDKGNPHQQLFSSRIMRKFLLGGNVSHRNQPLKSSISITPKTQAAPKTKNQTILQSPCRRQSQSPKRFHRPSQHRESQSPNP